ncbi:hypothetical protein MMC07_004010 [Pseudocyphellaria aurata]|nr:hypothetical protein [Pseudocyphellaria aurata]
MTDQRNSEKGVATTTATVTPMATVTAPPTAAATAAATVAATATPAKTTGTTPGPKTGRRIGGAGSGSDPPHVCGICNKCFDRRDLRDRHKRRCARSATKVKVSKRKSCLACAQSKLGCDLGTPACSRCVSRGTNCEYAVPPPSALAAAGVVGVAGALPTKPMPDRLQSQSSMQAARKASYAKQNSKLPYHANVQGYAGEMPSGSASSSASGYPTPPFYDNLMPWHDSFTNHQSFDLFGSLTSQPFLPHIPSTPSPGHGSSAAVEDVDAFNSREEMASQFRDWYHEHGISSAYQAQPNQMLGQWHMDPGSRHAREADQMQYSGSGSAETQSFSLFNALDIQAHDASLSPTNSAGHMDAHSTFFTTPAMPYEVSSSDSWRETSATRASSTSESTPDSAVGLFNLQPLASLAATSDVKSIPTTLLGDIDVITLVQSYPAMLLQKNFHPPFVHHQLYRCAEGGVAGPLANALCCVSAYASMVPGNKNFVYNMINSEREHLVRGFHMWSSSDVNALGALHAMCVYQIIGLLDVKDPAQIRNAEYQHPFFLKMARRICQGNLSSTAGTDATTSWQSWIVEESLRRILFLVTLVNTLSRRAHTHNPSYYEALDKELISHMALPAPDPMWKASSAEEWESAKRKVGWSSKRQRTVHMVMERLREGHGDEDNRRWFEDFQPLSLLIIACVRLRLS